MDELCTWYEVIRSLLPQRYPMYLIWERRTIVVISSFDSRVVRLTESDLRGRTPTMVVRELMRELATGCPPAKAMSA